MRSACITTSHCVSRAAVFLVASGLAPAQGWRPINSGLPVTVAGVQALAFDPVTPSIIYSVGGNGTLFKTSDGGGSWGPISRATSVRSVVIDPKNSANVYAVARNGVLKSADYGETCTTANLGLQSNYVYQLVIVPTDPPALYALAGAEDLFKSTDGAQSWHSVGPAFYYAGATGPIPIPHAPIGAVVVDPKNALTMYATGPEYADGLFKSTDGGVTWYSVTTPVGTYRLPVFNPGAPSTMYLWYSDYDFPAKTGGGHLLQSTDDGATWHDIGNGGVPADSNLESLAFDPRYPSVIYANYSSQSQGWGLVKSTDGGRTWNQLNTGLPPYKTPSIVAVGPDSTVYAGYVDLEIERGRLVKSADGGTSWSGADSGLTYIDVRTLAIDPTNAAAAYAGVGGGGEGVFKTADGGGQWSNLAQLLITEAAAPQAQGVLGVVNSLLIDFANPKVLYAATARIDRSCYYADKLLFKSTDGGTSWDNSASPPQGGCEFFYPPTVLTLVPTDSNELYLGGQDDCGDSVLDQSPDGGSDWKVLSALGLGSAVNGLAADPTNLSTLYAGAPQGVFKSTDGGASWTNVFGKGSVAALVMDPTQSKTLYSVLGNQYALSSGFQGVFKSIDGGANWFPINTGLDAVFAAGSLPTAITIAPRNPNAIYLATSGSGIYKSSDGGAHWTPFNESLTNLDVRVLTVSPGGLNRLYAATPGGVFTIVDERGRPLTPRR